MNRERDRWRCRVKVKAVAGVRVRCRFEGGEDDRDRRQYADRRQRKIRDRS